MKNLPRIQYQRVTLIFVILLETVTGQISDDTVTSTKLDPIHSKAISFTENKRPTDTELEKNVFSSTPRSVLPVRYQTVTDITSDQTDIFWSSDTKHTHLSSSLASLPVLSTTSSSISSPQSSQDVTKGAVSIAPTASTTETLESSTKVREKVNIGAHYTTLQDVNSERKPSTKPDVYGLNKSTPVTTPDVYGLNKSTPVTTPDVDGVYKPMPHVTQGIHNVKSSTSTFSEASIGNNSLLKSNIRTTPEPEMRLETVYKTGSTLKTIEAADMTGITKIPTTLEISDRTDEPTAPEVVNKTISSVRTPTTVSTASRTVNPITLDVVNKTISSVSTVNRTFKPITLEVVNKTISSGKTPTTVNTVNGTGEKLTVRVNTTLSSATSTLTTLNNSNETVGEPITMKTANTTESTKITTSNVSATVNSDPTSTVTRTASTAITSVSSDITASTAITSVSSDIHLTSTELLPRSTTPRTASADGVKASTDSLTTEGSTEGSETAVQNVSGSIVQPISKTEQVLVGETNFTTDFDAATTVTALAHNRTTIVEKPVNTSQNIDWTSTHPQSTDGSIVRIKHRMGDDEDDTYWPIAIAVTVGVPVIIVFAVTITVLNRKRKLEKAHNAALSGYITPPTEYDA